MALWRRLTASIGLCAALWLALTSALAQSKKPPIPPGRDPGGVAVAYIGGGVDYTRPEIAARLARDGEGEIIGWDFIDDDRRPYRRCELPHLPSFCQPPGAFSLLQDIASARLIIVRVDAKAPQTIVSSIVLVSQSPARIVLVAQEAAANPALLAEAAKRYPHVLFIIPAPARDTPESQPSAPNLISVAAANTAGPVDGFADVATPTVQIAWRDQGAAVFEPSEAAAGRIAALAARLLAAEPGLDEAALKRRIIALAKPLPTTFKTRTRHGWIEHPGQHVPVR